ncbi:hypothetical protein [Dysgonomonas sp. ZJ709]|uniref:IS66 family insertion sequence element accessory protein TnpA n=1 Tax=Dysgonomonas sp. ZJ709 TaxID=2709797 RepID=UPI0013EA044E|nr:hypothetical protein [Dysgonomonas sp. ZJ709]
MKKRKALNSAEAFPIVARYLKGDLLPHEVYRQEGWSDNQFYYWRKRYEKKYPTAEEPTAPSSEFHPIEIKNTDQAQSTHPDEMAHIELEYPNGVILRIGRALSDSRILSLIKLY